MHAKACPMVSFAWPEPLHAECAALPPQVLRAYAYHDCIDDMFAHCHPGLVRDSLEEVQGVILEQGEGGRLRCVRSTGQQI